ncbi:MAG: TIGR04282 family arsenosugar biosynthesis glycosyltransferase [Polyangiaceae bacterium]
MSKVITLAVMARAPVPGHCKTRLAREIGAVLAARLAEAMLRDVLTAYQALPVDRRVLLAAPEHDGFELLSALAPPGWHVLTQSEGDVGARMEAAQARLRPGRVMIVGSDVPLPPLDAITQAIEVWQDSQVLLGPAQDGGYYLIGLPLEEVRVFRDMPWSTDQVFARTRARCVELGYRLVELPPALDVDRAADLAPLLQMLEARTERAPHTWRELNNDALWVARSE